MAEAVRLDDHAQVTPEEVDLVQAEAGIHLRHGKPVAATEAEEDPLEFAAGELFLRLELI